MIEEPIRPDTLPLMVVISGLPASGKSTIAKELAARLHIPCFTKDDLKELLFDAGGYSEEAIDESTSDRLGAQAMAILYANAASLVEAGLPLLIEANFQADLTEPQLRPFLGRADVRQVYCQLPVDMVIDRFRERQQRDERHPVHAAVDDPEALARDLQRKDYGPIQLGIPTLIVDTTDGFEPPLDDIVRFCQSPTPAAS